MFSVCWACRTTRNTHEKSGGKHKRYNINKSQRQVALPRISSENLSRVRQHQYVVLRYEARGNLQATRYAYGNNTTLFSGTKHAITYKQRSRAPPPLLRYCRLPDGCLLIEKHATVHICRSLSGGLVKETNAMQRRKTTRNDIINHKYRGRQENKNKRFHSRYRGQV